MRGEQGPQSTITAADHSAGKTIPTQRAKGALRSDRPNSRAKSCAYPPIWLSALRAGAQVGLWRQISVRSRTAVRRLPTLLSLVRDRGWEVESNPNQEAGPSSSRQTNTATALSAPEQQEFPQFTISFLTSCSDRACGALGKAAWASFRRPCKQPDEIGHRRHASNGLNVGGQGSRRRRRGVAICIPKCSS